MKATLIKRATADGLVEVKDHVALGTVYELIPGSFRREVFIHTKSGIIHCKDVADTPEGMVFLEMLRLENEA